MEPANAAGQTPEGQFAEAFGKPARRKRIVMDDIRIQHCGLPETSAIL